MTHHTTVTPAAAVIAQLHDKYSNNIQQNNPNLISFFLMNHAAAMHQQKQLLELEIKRKQQQFHQQQKSYVSALVDVTVQVIASIWPNSISSPPTNNCSNTTTTNNAATKPIADLNTFLHHILKHSRTTHSTLQLAIFYLFRIRSRVAEKRHQDVYISCGRRMFLAALISAHKYLQDKTYKNSAWSKVSGLNVNEINHAEKVMLQLLDYRLYVKKDTYDQWISMLQTHLKVVPSVIGTTTEQQQQQQQQHSNLAAVQQQQQQQKKLLQLQQAQQSLPSPPLEDSWMSPSSLDNNNSKKRKNSFVVDSDDAPTKRRC